MPPADQPAQAPRTALDDYDLASLALCAFEGVTQPRITRTKWKDGIDLEIATPGLRRFADAVVERELSAARAEAERLREDFAMMIRRLAARLQMRTRGTLHEQADESLVASALDLMRRNGVDLSPLREHRLEQSALAATRKDSSNG